jgi:hypothetical protein
MSTVVIYRFRPVLCQAEKLAKNQVAVIIGEYDCFVHSGGMVTITLGGLENQEVQQ